jgi:hypothetical protein
MQVGDTAMQQQENSITEKTPSEKRARTRKITGFINELKMYRDFKTLTFIKQGNAHTGIIIMFDEAIVLDEKVDK